MLASATPLSRLDISFPFHGLVYMLSYAYLQLSRVLTYVRLTQSPIGTFPLRVLTYVRLTQSPIATLRLDFRPTRLIHFSSFVFRFFSFPFMIATVSYVLACAGLSASHAPAPTGFGRARELWRPNIVVWPPITLRVFFFSPLARVGHRGGNTYIYIPRHVPTTNFTCV